MVPEVVHLGGVAAVPAVVEHERGTVVDQPQARRRDAQGGPDHQVGAVDRAVDVHGQGVEPDDPPRLQGIDGEDPRDVRREVPGARQVVHAEVHALAGRVQAPHLLVRLVPRDHRVEVHQHQLGEAQPEGAGQLPHDHLGDQCLAALRGAGELHDVRAQVVGLDDSGYGSAGRQGCDVAGRGDLSQHVLGPCLPGSPSMAVRSLLPASAGMKRA
jgi:hypothetical protein